MRPAKNRAKPIGVGIGSGGGHIAHRCRNERSKLHSPAAVNSIGVGFIHD